MNDQETSEPTSDLSREDLRHIIETRLQDELALYVKGRVSDEARGAESPYLACLLIQKVAWGINNRPKVQLSDDEDDIVYFSDSELGTAPVDPGTYEGSHGKPISPDEFPNKWCILECERSVSSKNGDDVNKTLTLHDFSARVFNMPQPNIKKPQR